MYMQDGDYYNDCEGDYQDDDFDNGADDFDNGADDGQSYKILRRNSRQKAILAGCQTEAEAQAVGAEINRSLSMYGFVERITIMIIENEQQHNNPYQRQLYDRLPPSLGLQAD